MFFVKAYVHIVSSKGGQTRESICINTSTGVGNVIYIA